MKNELAKIYFLFSVPMIKTDTIYRVQMYPHTHHHLSIFQQNLPITNIKCSYNKMQNGIFKKSFIKLKREKSKLF